MENIKEIKNLVENTKDSYRSIAEKYNTNHTQIRNLIEKHGWNVEHRPKRNVSNISKSRETKPAHNKILGKVAHRKIEEIKNELGGHYSVVDEPIIVMYARNYESYIELEVQVQEEGIVFYSAKTGGAYLNPRFNAMLAIQKNLVTMANQLGLSISSRKKLGIKLGEENEEPTLFDIAGSFAIDGDDDLQELFQ